MPAGVTLVPVDEDVLARLLAVAVSDADPAEVMAPIPGNPGWTEQRRAAFLAYHRVARLSLPDSPPESEVTFAIVQADTVVGALRLATVSDDDDALEAGLWLGRHARGQGIGRAAVAQAIRTARQMHVHRLIARTTSENAAALGVLRGLGFVFRRPDQTGVEALLDLGPPDRTGSDRQPTAARDTATVTSTQLPPGYHSVTPRMVVADVAGAVGFLRAVFGATGESHEGRPAELRIGDSLVMVSQAGERDVFPAFLYVYVDDADAVYRRAVEAGATIIEQPCDMPYGDRRAMVRDPWGDVFQIAHRITAA